VAAAGKIDPMHQFTVEPLIPLHIGKYDISFTNSAAWMVAALLVIALSSTLGLMRLRYGARIEAIDGKLSAMTFEIFAGIAKLRSAAAEPRTFERWYAKYDEFRRKMDARRQDRNRDGNKTNHDAGDRGQRPN